MANKTMLVIDGNAIVHRAFHALPPLKTKKGELVNAVYGFFLIFLKALKELKPDFVTASFDLPGKTFRHEQYKEYKAKRPRAPEEIYLQINKVKELLKVFAVPIYEKGGFEADDVIGTIVEKAKLSFKDKPEEKIETIILTGDFDTLQLVSGSTKVYTMRKGFKDTAVYDVQAVKERYGLSPSQLIDFKALKGDASDNIPGVPGIGEKTAIGLLKKFESLEKIYEKLEETKEIKDRAKEILRKNKDLAHFSKQLSIIRKDVPISFNLKDCAFGTYSKKEAREAFEALGFYSLINQLSQNGTKDPSFQEAKKEKDVLSQIERLYREEIFSDKIYEIEKNLIEVVERMEKAGIGVSKKSLEDLSVQIGKKLQAVEEKIYELAGARFNINSPRQLSEILFKKLQISSKGLKRTPGGEISTAWPELKKQREENKIIDLIGDYKELFKLKSSFLDPLPAFVKAGRIHPNFDQLGAETGRFSCSEPNLQNVPIKGELGRAIRKCFVAKKGFKLVSADYSQMELRIAASLAGDKKLINFFREGKDIHRVTAAEIFGVKEKEVTERMREVAKRLNFGILYGMGPRSFSETARIPFKEAKEFIRKYYERFEEVADFERRCVEKARKKGFSETIFGRKRMLPEINSTDRRLQASAERMARNLPVQGTAADFIKQAMVRIDNFLLPYREEAKMVLQIHDELLFEIKEEKLLETTRKIKELMEDVADLAVPLIVEIKSGANWGELEELDPI